MEYKLKKSLPFMKIGEIFSTGTWVGGGFGVDLGKTHYEGGGSSHNGVKTFGKHINKLLNELLDNKDWIEKIPTHEFEVLNLFKNNEIEDTQAIKLLKKFIKQDI